MCPKAKATSTVSHRIEFQETERDLLEMVGASITARNVSQSVGSILSPILQMTPTSGVIFGSIISLIVAKAAADYAVSDSTGGVTTRVATSPWFIAFAADVQSALKL